MRAVSTVVAVFGLILVCATSKTEAQVTLQQPVIERFSVNTSVSVPDRGWAHLGSVSRAESFRNQYGFFQPGSSIGYSRMHSGLSVGVRIIDLREMDRMILGYDPRTISAVAPSPASLFYRAQPTNQRFDANKLAAQQEAARKKATQKLMASRKPGLASAWLKLGQKAQQRGKLDRARSCYGRAVGYGSKEASARLAALELPEPVVVAKPKPVGPSASSATSSKAATKSGPVLVVPED